jgi:hypothetical protein
MNPVKKIIVNFQKTRGIYEPHNIVYRQKYNPSQQKELKRMERRLNKINRYDDAETGEPAIEALTQNKAKLVFKMLGEFHNTHRLSRKEMPKEEKEEYIRKCKEFSLFKTNEWRHKYDEMKKCLRKEEDMMYISGFLPFHLCDEVLDVLEKNLPEDKNPKTIVPKGTKIAKGEEAYHSYHKSNVKRGFDEQYEREEVFKENLDNVESIEFTPQFLYLPQIMKIYPDDLHIIAKTMINMPAYESSKQAGVDEQGDSLNSAAPDDS